LLLAMLCNACSGSAAGLKPGQPGQPLLSGVTFTVLPETFAAGGTARVSAQTAFETDGRVRFDITASGAQDLRALCVALDYDPAQWHSAGGGASGALAGADATTAEAPLLQLTGETRPGHLEHAQALPAGVDGAASPGAAALASLWLAPGPARAERAAAPGLLPVPEELSYDPQQHELRWGYSLAGDYDQNGTVSVSDILPLAKYFKQANSYGFKYESIQAVVDGDRNGEVGLSDLTVIGRNLGTTLGQYELYASSDPATDYFAGMDRPAETASAWMGKGLDDTYYFYRVKYMLPAVPFAASDPLHVATFDPALSQRTDTERSGARLWLSEPYVLPAGQVLWLRSRSGGDCSAPSGLAARPLDAPVDGYPEDFGFAWDAGSSTFSCFSVLKGDFDCNDEVNTGDLNALGQQFNQAGPWAPGTRGYNTDANADLVIDFRDLRSVLRFFKANRMGLSYALFRVPDAASVPADPAVPEQGSPLADLEPQPGPVLGPMSWTTVVASPQPGWYYVRRHMDDGGYGPRSSALEVQ
jgi:hypothetical protein